jgi:hypothetical protein
MTGFFPPKGGGAGRAAKHHEDMDGNGARALTRLLEKRHGVVPPLRPRKRLVATEAAPVFHWLGVEPAGAAPRVEPQALRSEPGR